MNYSTGGVESSNIFEWLWGQCFPASPSLQVSQSFVLNESSITVNGLEMVHVGIISAQSKSAVLASCLEAHYSVSPLSAWAVHPTLHTCSSRKASSMQKPNLAPPRILCFVEILLLYLVQTGNWPCSDSTKTSNPTCHWHTWVGTPRGSWISASSESMTALL